MEASALKNDERRATPADKKCSQPPPFPLYLPPNRNGGPPDAAAPRGGGT